jgi:hypothetical protein
MTSFVEQGVYQGAPAAVGPIEVVSVQGHEGNNERVPKTT